MRFREARETLMRFVTTREGVVADDQLDFYRRERDLQLANLDRLASSAYWDADSKARAAVKNHRYDDAIRYFREVIEKFGIDEYARKAQAEINKIQAMKKG
jgi:hypothetical protein